MLTINPHYRKAKKDAKRKFWTEFLLNVVLDDSFDQLELEELTMYCYDAVEFDDPLEALVDYFGDWLYDELSACDFDVDEFLIDIEDYIKKGEA